MTIHDTGRLRSRRGTSLFEAMLALVALGLLVGALSGEMVEDAGWERERIARGDALATVRAETERLRAAGSAAALPDSVRFLRRHTLGTDRSRREMTVDVIVGWRCVGGDAAVVADGIRPTPDPTACADRGASVRLARVRVAYPSETGNTARVERQIALPAWGTADAYPAPLPTRMP